MTYESAIAHKGVEIRYILRIDGVDRYLGNYNDSWQDIYPEAYRAKGYTGGTWDDDNTHGELIIEPSIQDISVSGGSLDYANNMVTATTMSLTLADSAYLRSLFSRRGEVLYVDADMTASTTTATIPYASSIMAAGDYIHIGRECIKIITVNSGGITNCERGALGTQAESHPKGVDVSALPLHWRGRRAHLILFARTGPGTPWDSTEYLTAWIEGSPSYADGQWQLNLSNALSYFDRYIWSGFQDSNIDSIFIDSGQYAIKVDDDQYLLDPGDTAQKLGVILDFGGERCCYLVASHASNVVKINASSGDMFGTGLNLASWISSKFDGASALMQIGMIYYPDKGATLRPVFPSLNGIGGDQNPADIALRIMLSANGDQSAHADYDILPGASATSDRAEIRTGAGLTTDEVDVDAWEYAKFKSLSSAGFCIGADGPINLIQLLTTEIAPLCGGYVYVTRAGKISIKVYEPVTTTSSASFAIDDDNNIGADNCVDDESNILVSVKAPEEYDWAKGQYRTYHIAHYERNHHIYGRTAQTIELNSRLYSFSYHDVITVLDRVATRWGAGSIRYNVKLPWAAHLVDPGDTVTFTNPRIPNYSGTSGVTEQICEVTGKSISLSTGVVSLQIVVRPSGKYISPTAILTSDEGSDQWEFGSPYAATELGDDAWTEWAVGWLVTFISSDGDVRSATPTQITALESGGGTGVNARGLVTFDSPPGTIAVGDYMILCDYDDLAGDEIANAGKSADPTDYTYISAGGEYPEGARDRWS